jgi:NADH-quinone oxidoreductase subunit B
MGLEEKLGADSIITTRLDEVLAWGRANSLWPMPMGISCCAIEMMAAVGPKYDMARFGSEVLRFSPRQADLMIVAGTLTYKMAPIVRRIYDQMMEPKWVIAMGTCLCTGGMFDSYPVVQGLDNIIPVEAYIPNCPPRPEAVIQALLTIQRKIKRSSNVHYATRADEPVKLSLPATDTPIKAQRNPRAKIEKTAMSIFIDDYHGGDEDAAKATIEEYQKGSKHFKESVLTTWININKMPLRLIKSLFSIGAHKYNRLKQQRQKLKPGGPRANYVIMITSMCYFVIFN